MLRNLWEGIEPIRRLLGGFVVLIIAWHAFEAVIQPALVSINPIFADQGVYWTGRYPNTPSQAALVITVLIGLYVYYTLIALVYDGIDRFIDMWMVPIHFLKAIFYFSLAIFYFVVFGVPEIMHHQLKRLIPWE